MQTNPTGQVPKSKNKSRRAPVGKKPTRTKRTTTSVSKTTDPSDGLLTRYFRDVAPISVFEAGQEGDSARLMEQTHLATWQTLLGDIELVQDVLKAIGARVSDEAWTIAADKVKRTGSEPAHSRRGGRARFQKAVDAAAQTLKVLDRDMALPADVTGDLLVAWGLQQQASDQQPRSRRGRLRRRQQEHIAAVRARIQQAHQTRSDFISANLRLVIKIAKRYRNGSMPLVDLIQDGNLGLIEAVKRFDHRRGCRFSTYATWWIRHAICRALAERGRLVRIPLHVADAHRKVGRIRRELGARLGGPPPAEQVAHEAGLELEQVQSLDVDLSPLEVRLDQESSEGIRYGELVRDPYASEPLEDVVHSDASEKALQLVQDLDPVEADILRRRFGIDGREPQTLREIAREYNLSRERIRQLEHKGLGLVRKRLMRRPIRSAESAAC